MQAVSPTLTTLLTSSPDFPQSVIQNTELQESGASVHRCSAAVDQPIPLHSHSFVEHIFCRQAVHVEYLVGTHRYRIQPGDIIHIPSGVPHRPLFPNQSATTFVWDEVWLREDFVATFERRLPEKFLTDRKTPYLFRTDEIWRNEVNFLLQRGLEETEKKRFRWDNAVEGYAFLLMVTLSRILQDEKTQLLLQEAPTLFDNLLSYLEENLDRKITLEDTAKAFFVSKTTIYRLFQKNLGTSFYRWMTRRRLLAAQSMILQGLPLETVSRKSGFADYATFYRAFKQEFGISPRNFWKSSNSPVP